MENALDGFVVSARKYRPITFDSVVGQEHITQTLRNSILKNQLGQAFLFCGPRGVGKTTCARILAKSINCENFNEKGEPCGSCSMCEAFQNNSSFNVYELDAASNNSVEDIRSLVDQVRYMPQQGKYKVYIIDEVHMLSVAAFNAFLKTLEEPPSYAIFILATTEKHKILPTILSRCQIFDFNRIKVTDIAQHLVGIAEKEEVSVEETGLHYIAQKADGALRDALSIFDRIVSYSNRNVTIQSVIECLNILDYDYFFKFTDFALEENSAEILVLFHETVDKGFDGEVFLHGLSQHMRDLFVAKSPRTIELLEVSDAVKEKYQEQAAKCSSSFLITVINLLNQCEVGYKAAYNKLLHIEVALLKIAHLNGILAGGVLEVEKKK